MYALVIIANLIGIAAAPGTTTRLEVTVLGVFPTLSSCSRVRDNTVDLDRYLQSYGMKITPGSETSARAVCTKWTLPPLPKP